MGDVAQILRDTQAGKASSRAAPRPGDGTMSSGQSPPKAMKMSGMSREVMHLLGGKQDVKSAAMPPLVPNFAAESGASSTSQVQGGGSSIAETKVRVGNKWISSTKLARPWAWAPFASSSRTDGAMFRHWVRANVEYTDYPYAKFDIHLDPVTYSEEEYARHLKSETWSKSQTDKLVELARKLELRWAVIHDRWLDHYQAQEDGNAAASRKVEDLQERYYSVAATLSQMRISQEARAEAQALSVAVPDPSAPDVKDKAEQLMLETAAARALAATATKSQPVITNIGTGTSNKSFDATYERERRSHLDQLWKRSKEEENEEVELRKELKLIEAQLRKLKKSGGHLLASGNGTQSSSRLSSAASSRNPSRSVSPVPGATVVDNPEILNQSFASTAPTPAPQTPYLQSGRLVPPATGGSVGLNKTMLSRMQQFLAELKISSRPVPTKRVCDLYDDVRKDILTVITLQKMVMQKEGNLQTKRVKLSKLGVGEMRGLDEETLLGIAPAPVPAASSQQASQASKGAKVTKPSKSKTPSGVSKQKAVASKPKTPSDDSRAKTDSKDSKEGNAKKPKTGAKRKRKTEPTTKEGKDTGRKSPIPVPSAVATATAAMSASPVPTPGATAGAQVKPNPPTKPVHIVRPPPSASDVLSTDAKQTGAKKRPRKV